MSSTCESLNKSLWQRWADAGKLLSLMVVLSGAFSVFGQTVTSTVQPADKIRQNPADAVNQGLPRWMKFTLEVRGREEGRTSFGFKEGADDTYTLTRIRVGLDLKPAKWFRLYVQGQDSRAIDIASSRATPGVKNIFDLRQGFIELKAGEKDWVGLQIGRSELNLGNQRLVGGGDWGNVTRTFDVAKVTMASGANRVDVFAATPVVVYTNRFDRFGSVSGQNLYGIYGTLGKLVSRSTIEPYVLWKRNPDAFSETGRLGNADIYTTGALWFGSLPAGFDYTLEIARQTGHTSSDHIRAWAGYGIAGYTVPNAPLQPRFSTEYTYASGDATSGDGASNTFDQVYGAYHNVYGMSDLFGWRNIRHLRTSVEIKPGRAFKVTFDYHFLWLASAQDGLYNASGVQVVKAPLEDALHTDIGRDADFYLTYTPRPWLTFGTGWSYLFWGQFLKENAHGVESSYPWVFCTYRF